MSYSANGGLLGNGLSGTNPDQGANAPPGTEYTLQGVMRFLQMEWHSHERARNSWDIERAEMKAKIAKQEGELRHSKRMTDQLDRQIRMLETALKKERGKAHTNGINGDSEIKESDVEIGGKQADGKPGRPTNAPHQSFMAITDYETSTEELEKCRDKSKKYLEKCLQEVQYLLTPPPHPVPAKVHPQNGAYTGLTDPPPPPQLEEVYIRHGSQRGLPTSHISTGSQAPTSRPPELAPVRRPVDDIYLPRDGQFPERSHPSADLNNATPDTPNPRDMSEEPVEIITHSYDSYGVPIPNVNPLVSTKSAQDADGWDFEEQQAIALAEHGEAPRRPDTDLFPSAAESPNKLLSPRGPGRRRSSGAGGLRRKSSGSVETHDSGVEMTRHDQDKNMFKVRFALRGHLDVVRSVISTGGGSPSEPEICTAGDDGTIKRWIIPASYGSIPNAHALNDLDISCYFTHRGHDGMITSLAACQSTNFSTGGRASGDGWIFSGGQDATVRVWERGRVDPKATLDGHTDAVWAVCVLPGTTGTIFGNDCNNVGGSDRIVVASGSADGTVRIWTVSAPPQLSVPQSGAARRGVGGSRRHSVTSGSNHPSSPQPNVATSTMLHHTLVHTIARPQGSTASPTSICPLGTNGENFVVSYTDASVLVFDTRTGEEVIGMASNETYDGTMDTSINSVVARAVPSAWGEEQDESMGAGATGTAQGLEGVVVSGHEDRYIRFFDANSGQCTYGMLAHPAAISSLSLSPDGHEAVSAGHDASIRFWSLDKRICTQEITCHRAMRGEGVCSVVWSTDGRYVVSGGGDGVVKVFAR